MKDPVNTISPGLERVEAIMNEKQCTFNDALFLFLTEIHIYDIDDMGQIWKTGHVWDNKYYKISGRERAERIVHKHGYVEILFEGRRRILASRLVYLYHKGGIPDDMCIQNINCDPNDNHPDNLRLFTLYGSKKQNLVNILSPEHRMILDNIVKTRVESLTGDGIICVNSHSHTIKKAFPELSPRKLGYMLSIYMLEHHNEWDIDEDNSRSKSKRYRISRKEMPATMTHEAGVVCV